MANTHVINPALAAAKAVSETVNCDGCVYHYKDTNQKPCNTCVHSQELSNNFEPRNQVAKAVSEQSAQPSQAVELSDEDIDRVAHNAGIHAEPRFGLVSTGNVQMRHFARAIVAAINAKEAK